MKDHIWNAYFLGVLATEDDMEEGREPIFVNNQNTVQFFIRIISQEPESFPNINKVTCYSNELEKWGFEDDQTIFEDEKRNERLKSFLKDSLLIFQVQRRYVSRYEEYYIARNVDLIAKKDSFQKNDSFNLTPIPIYRESDDISTEEFEKRLIERKYIGDNTYVSNEANDTPLFLIWQKSEESQIIYGQFEGHTYAHGGFRFIYDNALRRLDFLPSWQEEIYFQRDIDVCFVPNNVYEQIEKRLSTAELLHTSDMEKSSLNTIEQLSTKKEMEINEDFFMQNFIEETKRMNLFYAEMDLYNFHVAMKTQSLVILAGMSGTGKTQLVNAYGKALGLEENQMSIIPVRPSWTDDTDLLGYPDTLNNVYRPGDSGLVNTLIKAEIQSDMLHIICFDEMNLARVEHYFSQFLSVLEMEENQRILHLYNDDLQHRFYNGDQYKPKIKIGDNVLFVGTVNLDESTHHFSDKVLDRANVIELKVLPFRYLLQIDSIKEVRKKEKRIVISKKIYNQFRNVDRKLHLSEQELELFWELHQLLKKTNGKMGIGPRVIRQIDRYLKNLPMPSPISRAEALDLQIVQRILTKIRGPIDTLEILIGKYNSAEDTIISSLLYDLLDKYKQLSSFTLTRKKVLEKAKELAINGYTI